ncbi:hypothetical protein N7468_000261 [Penicillium chermesinum]|uniref:Uncharacterized protein n=1 Tax=Penicillium chermesinum TaxID=63820 RepID=A0A9W9TZ43_9EURO|nr:uncharacterized protein N7468_000261 [Penicillium chermesinum]KAJ5248810.1 hypothetical protein N7468_000261 [Penicillium chermesinum]
MAPATPTTKKGKGRKKPEPKPSTPEPPMEPEVPYPQIPETHLGGPDTPDPGPWATHIREFAWTCEPKRTAPATLSTCQILRLLTSKREPHVRRLCGQDLHVKISSRTENVEAALAQVSGEEAGTPCERCQAGLGPWVSCVVAEEFGGGCANWELPVGVCSELRSIDGFGSAPSGGKTEVNGFHGVSGSRVMKGRTGGSQVDGHRLQKLRLSLASMEDVLYEIAMGLDSAGELRPENAWKKEGNGEEDLKTPVVGEEAKKEVALEEEETDS